MCDTTPILTADRWQLLPALSTEEFESLKRDIAAQGMLVPVVVDGLTGHLVDGHHRVKAWTELRTEGLKLVDYPKQVVHFKSDEDRVAFVVSSNLFRRHLTREQRAGVVARLRSEGWSLRRIGEVVGADPATVHRDLSTVASATVMPERIIGKDGRSQPANRPRTTIYVQSDRDAQRAGEALRALGDDAPRKVLALKAAEERARDARMAQLRSTKVAPVIEGPQYELRLGDLRETWVDVPDHSIDAVLADPPYNAEGVPLYQDLAELAARVVRPGGMCAIYCGHIALDEEMRLLEKGGLRYLWHGVIVLPGRHSQIHTKLINGNHRSVLLYSAGTFVPRKWIHDTAYAEGGGADGRPLHKWQQSVGPMRHWVWAISEPGETIFDPFVGSGTSAVAAVTEGRRFLGGDLDPACVETARQRLEGLDEDRGDHSRCDPI